MNEKNLLDGLNVLNLPASGKFIKQLEIYVSEIALWNPQYKLIASTDHILTRHILDSLAALSIIRSFHPERIADIGSGAGLPGIPLALFLPETHFMLIERSGRRAGFLRHVVLRLNLKNVTVVEQSVEEFNPEHPFDLITFRALSALDSSLIKKLRRLLSPSGIIAAYKGRHSVARSELDLVAHSLEYSELKPVSVPDLAQERCLLLLKPLRS